MSERASGSACLLCLHGWDCDGMRPEAACLGLLLGILRYSLHAGLLGACRGSFPSLVHGSYTHAVKHSSLVVSSLLPGPWVWGERDSTVGGTVTIRVRLR